MCRESDHDIIAPPQRGEALTELRQGGAERRTAQAAALLRFRQQLRQHRRANGEQAGVAHAQAAETPERACEID